jgi:RNA polymerase sigma-70 factor (ECF subfamily)
MKYATFSANQLARACAYSEEAEAWEEFVRRFMPTIATVVRRILMRYGESSPFLIQDLVQETFFKCLADDRRLLRKFEPRYEDAFYGMLKVTATNLVHDHFRARPLPIRLGKADVELSEVENVMPSTSSGPGQMGHNVRMREVEEALQSITSSSSSGERDREIFWLHHRFGFTANEIAAIPTFRLTDKGVESILHRLKIQLREWFVENEENEELDEEATEGISPPKTLSKGEEQP